MNWKSDNDAPWSRRDWLSVNGTALLAVAGAIPQGGIETAGLWQTDARAMRSRTSALADTTAWQMLAQHGVDAAREAGASYADVRITRTVTHLYRFQSPPGNYFGGDYEFTGVGVRAFFQGYWGFAASPRLDLDTTVRLAREAVAQAKSNAMGSPRSADPGAYPPARGEWATPMRIDAFSIPLEEKNDHITSWIDFSERIGTPIYREGSHLMFGRQERVVATSDGSAFVQRTYETGGKIECHRPSATLRVALDGLEHRGAGWELILDAKIPDQLAHVHERIAEAEQRSVGQRPVTVGRYPIVCDGATMAVLADQTLGLATQLDRALGYEANASGTSFITNPLEAVGQFQVASPLITLTANRSAARQLATVRWDDEGVEPRNTTLVKNGVLQDFQTTRDQTGWLEPYYKKMGHSARSNGYAASEHALKCTMQLSPNLALSPSAENVTLTDLMSSVSEGILLTEGTIETDFQARNGLLMGTMRRIRNGRVGPELSGGAVLFNALDLWQHLMAVAGAGTAHMVSWSQYPLGSAFSRYGYTQNIKGQPQQITGHSVTAPAALLAPQAVIDPTRKA